MLKVKIFLAVVIFSATCVTRCCYFGHLRPYSLAPESFHPVLEMERLGDRIAREGRMGNLYADDSGASAHVAPLYAYFLAALDRLVGLDPVRFRFAQGVAAILSTALFAASLPFLGDRAKLSRGVGTVAGLMAMLSPLGFGFEIRGDWETTFVPPALAAVLWSFMSLHDRCWGDARVAAAAGLVLGVGSLLSPVVLSAGLLAILGELLAFRPGAVRVVRGGSIVLIVAVLVIAPWVYRNYACFSTFVPIRSNFGLEFAVGNNPYAQGYTPIAEDQVPVPHPWGGSRIETEMYRTMGEINYNRAKFHEARDWVRAHPGQFAALTVRRFFLFWFPFSDRVLGGQRYIPLPIKAGALAVVTALSFAGLAWLMVSRHPYRLLLLGILVGPSIPYMITHVSYRYRYPVVGFGYLLCCECLARGISAARRSWGKERSDRPMPTPGCQ